MIWKVLSIFLLAIALLECEGLRARRDGQEEEQAQPTTVPTEAPLTTVPPEAPLTTVPPEAPLTTVPPEAPGTTDEPRTTEAPQNQENVHDSSPPSPPPPSTSGFAANVPKAELTTPVAWINEAIAVHNTFRAKHDAGPLLYNQTLSEIAQAWANKIAEIGEDTHSADASGAKLGENLYKTSNSAEGVTLEAAKPVNSWYAEIKDYDFREGRSKDKKMVLHFTQLVWKATTEVGLAYASSKTPTNGMYTTFVVANYWVIGNWGEDSDFVANVAPPTGQDVASPSGTSRVSTTASVILGCSLAYFFLSVRRA